MRASLSACCRASSRCALYLSHSEEEDGGDDGEAGGEDEASDGHRGLHGLPKAAVEWSADRGCSKFGS